MKDPSVTEALALSDEDFERRYWNSPALTAAFAEVLGPV
jgi:hypothetical protein